MFLLYSLNMFKKRSPVFSSERLHFYTQTEQDIPLFKRIYQDPVMMKYMGGVKSDDEATRVINLVLEHFEKHRFGVYFLTLKEDDQFVGFVSLKYISDNPTTRDRPDLGFGLDPSFQGRGLATEAGSATIHFAAKNFGIKKFEAHNYEENVPSTKVLERLNFKQVGSQEIIYQGRNYGMANGWILDL